MIKFGPSGMDASFREENHKNYFEIFEWLNSLGLNAFEFNFGRGVNLSEENAIIYGEYARKYGISVSVHAPYYINLANPSDEMIEKSYAHILQSLKLARSLGSNRIVVHSGSCGKLSREKALSLIKERLTAFHQIMIDNGYADCFLCLETMGKYTQIGGYQEIVDFCKLSPMFIPTLDFGHLNCLMQGGIKTENDYKKILQYCINQLGIEKMKNVHIHFSKIEFTSKGEVKHLTLEDEKYGPEFEPLARVLKELKMEPVIICESRDVMARDAEKLKAIYNSI